MIADIINKQTYPKDITDNEDSETEERRIQEW